MALRIVTWNVNSVRVRLEHLERLVGMAVPDVVCLQETRVADAAFPRERVQALGFPHVYTNGEKGRNGVAILSRPAFTRAWRLHWAGRGDSRHAAVALDEGPEVHTFYVPKGGHEPDPEASEAFAHKLAFLDDMRDWAREQGRRARPIVLTGDLNVAPLEADVWNSKRLRRNVGHTPVEARRLLAVQRAGGFLDAERAVVPPDEPLFTWWGYRHPQAFARDRGWRLDHVWLTPPLARRLAGMEVWRLVRGWPRPSDHAPVVVDLD